jgi:ribonuclease HI
VPTLRITLTFDGGSRGNPGPAYGSYVLESKDPRLRRPRPIRLTFAHGTNNEAEYWTLLKALQDTSAMLLGLRVPLEDVELTVRGDSQLVLSQVAGEWKAKDDRMRRLRGEVQELLEPFGRVRFQHQPRSRSVRQLGH